MDMFAGDMSQATPWPEGLPGLEREHITDVPTQKVYNQAYGCSVCYYSDSGSQRKFKQAALMWWRERIYRPDNSGFDDEIHDLSEPELFPLPWQDAVDDWARLEDDWPTSEVFVTYYGDGRSYLAQHIFFLSYTAQRARKTSGIIPILGMMGMMGMIGIMGMISRYPQRKTPNIK